MNDVTMYETGDGGDLNLVGNDIEQTTGLFNFIYMKLFGGNMEPENVAIDQSEQLERFDYWGNDLFLQSEAGKQYISRTERVLSRVAFTSSGRGEIIAAVQRDLADITAFASIENIDVFLTDVDRAEILIQIRELGATQIQEFQFIWTGVRLEAITERSV